MAKQLYQVQPGDTLISIAKARLGEEPRWQEIAYINNLSQPYIIYPGQLIMLPSLDEPLEFVITAPIAQPDNAATPEVDFKLSPAEFGLLAGGVVLFFWIMMR